MSLIEQILKDRKDMPQISDFESFIKDITESGYMMIAKDVDPKQLIPTQKNFNDEKVQSIFDNNSYNNKAIITTNDGCILDGHHRWKACCMSDDLQKVLEINMGFDELYNYVQDKDYVEFKGINESFDLSSSMGDFAGSETYKSKTKLKSFDDFIKELKEDDGGAVAGDAPATQINSTANMDTPQIPLFKNTIKRNENKE